MFPRKLAVACECVRLDRPGRAGCMCKMFLFQRNSVVRIYQSESPIRSGMRVVVHGCTSSFSLSMSFRHEVLELPPLSFAPIELL